MAFLGRERELAQRVSTLIRSDPVLPISDSIRQINRRCQALLREALLARRNDIHHPDPGAAIEFADMAMSAAARELLLFDDARMGRGEHVSKRRIFVEQLTELGCGYLRIA